MKIKVKLFDTECMPQINEDGDWIDLKVKDDTKCPYRVVTYVKLGVAMQLPKGLEAIVVPRSSTPKKKKVLLANSVGIIDNSYAGDNDEWCFPAYPISKEVTLKKGDRICQFRIQPSQFATTWQKIKFLFSGKPKFVVVEALDNEDREGLGHSGN